MCALTRREVTGLQMAERLETLTDGLIRVVHCPEALLAGQQAESAGHKYYCYLEAEPTEFWLDDREADPLPSQMAARIRQLAVRLDQLADKFEAAPAVL
jgi:hypothetical protein